ncbi:hypothetical protein [Archangium sp.]|uniref:hypothetical protein n=1 Tax=Archangium sp. TaxID=1872627 RepID=UPI002D678C21|nr:hypothetical protein [Archangium sp.]HYO59835.1 hypothetical protein [Archangium sp.]
MMTLFQRRQDAQVLRILRGIGAKDAHELGDANALLSLVDERACPWMATTKLLHEECDLGKVEHSGAACCTKRPLTDCHLKRHTVLLKRYGDFGKAPTSAALVLREAGADSFNEIKAQVFVQEPNPLERSKRMIEVVSQAWRVSEKIASMFLSAVTNPDLPGSAPSWSAGLDWTFFVVIDSNVDLFLKSIGLPAGLDYSSKRTFIRTLAHSINLRRLRPELHPYNPRLVQQAIYMFMSASSRRLSARDCSRSGGSACRRCPREMSERCPVRVELS